MAGRSGSVRVEDTKRTLVEFRVGAKTGVGGGEGGGPGGRRGWSAFQTYASDGEMEFLEQLQASPVPGDRDVIYVYRQHPDTGVWSLFQSSTNTAPSSIRAEDAEQHSATMSLSSLNVAITHQREEEANLRKRIAALEENAREAQERCRAAQAEAEKAQDRVQREREWMMTELQTIRDHMQTTRESANAEERNCIEAIKSYREQCAAEKKRMREDVEMTADQMQLLNTKLQTATENQMDKENTAAIITVERKLHHMESFDRMAALTERLLEARAAMVPSQEATPTSKLADGMSAFIQDKEKVGMAFNVILALFGKSPPTE